ncbi:MAG: 4Fe-4S binding protein [Planctomycetota bacterium]|jgi:ferredoxin
MSEKKDWTREELERDILPRMKARTIHVGVSFEGKNRILDMSETRELLAGAKRIVQTECGCRARVGGCIEPMDGCLSLDERAEWGLKAGGREVGLEEALAALERTFDAGLVHMAYVFGEDEEPGQICSCCSCCCHSLAAAVRFGYDDHVVFSKMISEQDEYTCNSCGACVDRCQFGARRMEKGEFLFDEEKCAGCGLCVASCPVEAISMVPRED